MADAALVALISGGTTGIASIATALLTSRGAKSQAEATTAVAQSQGAVELTRLDAEDRRLKAATVEEDRRLRRDVYKRLLTEADAIEEFAYGLRALTPEAYLEWKARFDALVNETLIVAPEAVAARVNDWALHFGPLAKTMESGEMETEAAARGLRAAFEQTDDARVEAWGSLIDAMRADLATDSEPARAETQTES